MRKMAGSGSIGQRHGSADPDPDPHQNAMDPQHCFSGCGFGVRGWTDPNLRMNVVALYFSSSKSLNFTDHMNIEHCIRDPAFLDFATEKKI
jgi:hypothetical protein